MRSTFSFDDDKQLVQMARTYIDDGTRITWKDIARRMRPTGHSAAELRQRLQSLFRTWGRDIARFPSSFFTEVRRPRGRPPAITLQLRNLAAHSSPGRSRQAGATATTTTRPGAAPPRKACQSAAVSRPSTAGEATRPEARQASAVVVPTAHPAVDPPHVAQQVPAPPVGGPAGEAPSASAVRKIPAPPGQGPAGEEAVASAVQQVPLPPESSLSGAATLPEYRACSTTAEARMPPDDCRHTKQFSAEGEECGESEEEPAAPFRLAQTMPILSPSSAEEAVTSMFADVPRAAVGYDGGSSHLNVGEVLPSGVTVLLQELGDVDSSDVFLDIGSGLGNVIAQVVLATKMSMAIGVEMRADIYRLGVEMIARSPHGRQVNERAEIYCKDIAGLCISRLPPYELATIVFWYNLLFEPVAIEYVKRELADMLRVRFIVCTTSVCPRHREPCFSAFCCSFELFKEVYIACSWKAETLRTYVYRSFGSF
ncbi:unnamed protein product [Phytophthora fragariaefolia]|uniref:Histone-lysine N-methyltransferase, H3 lysine-79 specific n=1 Tax=Phytophthora fragariaefolia TaxID=1490495 RepID=A0A9W6XNT9_9STRA|nr:unnamed protein product [Phytophthora fragariaefolia]